MTTTAPELDEELFDIVRKEVEPFTISAVDAADLTVDILRAIALGGYVVVKEELLAAANDQQTRTLAEAMRTFAPDLMEEFARRWNTSKVESDRSFEQLLAMMRG